MNTRRLLHRIGPAAVAASLCLAGAALAAEPLPTITIGAGVMAKAVVGTTTIGAPMEEVTITHRVSYSDLDLTTQTGAAELKARVKETANAACKQLDELYPLEEKNARECTSTAIAQASPQVENAIAAARRGATAE